MGAPGGAERRVVLPALGVPSPRARQKGPLFVLCIAIRLLLEPGLGGFQTVVAVAMETEVPYTQGTGRSRDAMPAVSVRKSADGSVLRGVWHRAAAGMSALYSRGKPRRQVLPRMWSPSR